MHTKIQLYTFRDFSAPNSNIFISGYGYYLCLLLQTLWALNPCKGLNDTYQNNSTFTADTWWDLTLRLVGIDVWTDLFEICRIENEYHDFLVVLNPEPKHECHISTANVHMNEQKIKMNVLTSYVCIQGLCRPNKNNM